MGGGEEKKNTFGKILLIVYLKIVATYKSKLY